jgi:Cysteine-rich CWC
MENGDTNASPIFPEFACLGRDEKCPLCGGDNQCRVAKGHLYKGPCWCHEIVISPHIPGRLAQDLLEQTCLCPTCLETVARLTREYSDPERAVAEIHKTVERRVSAQEDYYLENGNVVFTAAYHLKHLLRERMPPLSFLTPAK